MDALSLYRLSRWLRRRRLEALSRLVDRFNYLIFNCFVPGSAEIGEGTRLAYGGMCVVIHSQSKIGRNCLIGQGVTLGAKEPFVSRQPNPSPVLEDDVYVAAGAKILGGVVIGHSSVVGANAVVLRSCEPHSILAGAPARQVGQTDRDYQVFR